MRLSTWLASLLLIAPLVFVAGHDEAESCIQFRAPTGSVNPGQRDPADPAPETTEPADDEPAAGDGPTTPPPTTPPGTGPITTGGPSPTTPAPSMGGTGRKAPAMDNTTWETWWELNRVEFFPRRWVQPEITPEEGELVRSGPQPLHPSRVQSMWPIIRKLADHKHVFVREAALITLGRVAANEAQRDEARALLTKRLKDRNALVARSAALGLFYVADETSVLPMYEVASNKKTDEDVRAFLALTLTNLEHPMATGLLQSLSDVRDGYYELVGSALMGLGYNGADASAAEKTTIPAFLKEVAFEKRKVRREFRALAVESFGRIGDLELGLAPLTKALTDKDVAVRRSAAIALGVLDWRTEAERKIEALRAPYDQYVGVPLTPEDAARIETLTAEIEPQRLAMAKKVKGTIKRLGEAMQRDNDGFTKRMAAISLGRIYAHNPQNLALRYLNGAIKRNRFGMREYAVLALGIAGAPEAQEVALRFASERNPSTRGAGCITLGLIGNPDRVNPLPEATRTAADTRLRELIKSDPHPVIRGYAALACGLCGQASAADEILAMVRGSSSPTPRAYGALGLALLGTKKGADDIVAFIRSDQMRNGFVASHMVYALGLTKDRRSDTFDSLLEKAQDDGDQYVQAATLAAIGYLSSGEFYPRRHLMARGYNYTLNLDYIDTYFFKL